MTANMLTMGAGGSGQLLSDGKMWGNAWRNNDPNCPVVITRETYQGGYGSSLPPRFCISVDGIVYSSDTRVGRCEICNAAGGNCYPLRVALPSP
jgi:hypothetical protein